MTLLTREEVVRLTNRRQRKRQVEHLAAQGIPFTLDADGWPVVSSDALRKGRNQMEAMAMEALLRAS